MKATIKYELDDKHPGKPWVLALYADITNPVEAVFETREDAEEIVGILNMDAVASNTEIIVLTGE